MVVRVPVKPELLSWAVDRSGISPEVVARRFPKFGEWESGQTVPTFKQLEGFANATHAPLGFFFLDKPPIERVPIPDFRTMGNAALHAPSPDLLDTVYACQMRQDWYETYAKQQGFSPLPFVGSVSVTDGVEPVAASVRKELKFDLPDRAKYASWEDALRSMIDLIEDMGVLVMVSGIVGGNTHRKLDAAEFRGFALSDSIAPLIFVNGSDTKAAQIFTMVHELAHIWLGETALSDAKMADTVGNAHELWCNKVAAEVLVPSASIHAEYRQDTSLAELERLAKLFRVSTLVVLKRIHDVGFLTWDSYTAQYETELERILQILAMRRATSAGGNYYNTQPLRISRQFARSVIVNTLEGGTLYRDACGLLGTAKRETFDHLARDLGVAS